MTIERKRLSVALTPTNIIDKHVIDIMDKLQAVSPRSLLISGVTLTLIDPRLPNLICAMITENGIKAEDIIKLLNTFINDDNRIKSTNHTPDNVDETNKIEVTKKNSKAIFGDR